MGGIRGSRLARQEELVIPVEPSAANINQTFDLGDRPTFYVVIIYQDISAGRRAKHFYDRVVQALTDEYNFSLEVWNFQVLALPEIGNSVAQATAQADCVILSMHGQAQLSVQIRHWIERWSGLIADYKPALVALLAQPETRRGTVPSALDYLRSVADRAGIDLFTHTVFCRSANWKVAEYGLMDLGRSSEQNRSPY
jgi:hypothetical protein